MKSPIPEAALTQHIAILGKTGSGKTSTGKLIIEHVVEAGSRVCVLDPVKSDWWGLTSSADGRRPGLPFSILGGPRGHVPLHASAGKAIGELVARGDLRHSIIDMADFEAGGHSKFFVDFAATLMKRMRGVLYLVIEEAHEFAPKERAGIGAETLAIHYAKKLATAGRTKGIRLMILTQRTQALHNALLGSCETLIAHKLTAPADQDPVLKWLKANAPAAIRQTVSDSLSKLPTGTGWICSGETFERVAFPRIHTYDNTATPEDDEEERDVKTAPVDLEKLRQVIGNVVADAEANDPEILKNRIRELETQVKGIGGLRPEETRAAQDTGYRCGIEDGLADGLRQFSSLRETALKALRAQIDDIGEIFTQSFETAMAKAAVVTLPDWTPQASVTMHPQSASMKPATRRALEEVASHAARQVSAGLKPGRNLADNGAGEKLTKAQRALLMALVQHHRGRTNPQLAISAGYSLRSSSFQNALSALRVAGYATKAGIVPIQATIEGRAALGDYERLPKGPELIAHWYGQLSKAERALLEVCVRHFGGPALSKEQLAEQSGYSVNSSSFQNALSKLRVLELVDRGAEIRASEDLFS